MNFALPVLYFRTPNLLSYICRVVVRTIARVVYGIDIAGEVGKEYMRIVKRVAECINSAFRPGRYLVQTFPWLRLVPAWFPGAQF